MTNERDPQLEALFAQAQTDIPNGDFAQRVMSDVDTRRRNVLLVRLALITLIVVLELLLSAPIQGTLGIIMKALGTPLVDLENPAVELVLAPLNSVAGIVGGLLLLLHFLYRKVLH